MTPGLKSIITWSFVALLAFAGVMAIFFGVRGLLRAHASENWPSVEGRIVQSEVKKRGSGANSSKRFYAEVSYEFSVDGATFTGNRIVFEYLRKGSITQAKGIVNRYRKGKKVTVFYMPEDPEQCVLQPGLQLRGLGWPVGGLVLLLIAGVIGCAAVAVAKDDRKAAEPESDAHA